MTVGNVNSEVYSISDARTGAIRVSRLTLTGWGAAPTASAGLFTFSDQGRLWGVFTQSSGDLSLYRRSTADADDKVCSGTVSAGKVTLAAANTSGVTGTSDVDDGTPGTNPAADSTFDVVVSYADEKSLASVLNGAESLLTSATWQGEGSRFEKLLEESKRELDKWLVSSFSPRLKLDTWGRYMLAHIVNHADLKRVHALLSASFAVLGRSGFIDQAEDKSAFYMQQAREAFKTFGPIIDYERDLSPDNRKTPGVVRFWRS